MIERIFRSSRFLVLVAVATTAVSAVLLYGVSLNTMIHLLLELTQQFPSSANDSKSLAVKLLKLLDLLLIAITFQLIAISLYRLFVKPLPAERSASLGPLDIRSFHDRSGSRVLRALPQRPTTQGRPFTRELLR